jgi:hypothetical protein
MSAQQFPPMAATEASGLVIFAQQARRHPIHGEMEGE